jgi:hypothetical protein
MDEWDRQMALDFAPGGRGVHVIEKVKADIRADSPVSHRMMTFRSRASEEFWGLYNRMPRSPQ